PAEPFSGARLLVRCVDRADDVPGAQRQRRGIRRAGDQALMELAMRIRTLLTWAAAAGAVGCVTMTSDSETSAKAAQVMKASFKDAGQAKLDRLDQDDTQRLWSLYAGKALAKAAPARSEGA